MVEEGAISEAQNCHGECIYSFYEYDKMKMKRHLTSQTNFCVSVIKQLLSYVEESRHHVEVEKDEYSQLHGCHFPVKIPCENKQKL